MNSFISTYNSHYQHFNSTSRRSQSIKIKYFKSLIPEFIINKGGVALDYGCGTGQFVSYLDSTGIFDSVFGVDISESQIDASKLITNGCHLIDSVNDKFFKNKKFDVIFLMDVIEHVPINELHHFLLSLESLIKDDGIIFVSVPNASSPFGHRHRYDDITHFNSFTTQTLKFAFSSAGFAFIAQHPNEFYKANSLSHLPIYLVQKLFRFVYKIWMISEYGFQVLSEPLSLNISMCFKRKPHENKIIPT